MKNNIFFIGLLLVFIYTEPGKTQKYYTIKKGETLWQISKKYKIPIDEICKLNNIKNISKVKAGSKIYLQKSSKNTYSRPHSIIIKKGETLWQISKKYKIPIDEICKLNNIKNISKVKAGSKIYLPSCLQEKSTENEEKINITLRLPVSGEIVKDFGIGDNIVKLNGIELKSKNCQDVFASATGIVKYAGFLKGYGKIIIIHHPGKISTVYAYLDEIFVKPEENVYTGKRIGKLNGNNLLYFQLLKENKPLDPKKYFKYD
jgi:murein DD-endopeptidase MepM/ murein hydrolase activator NlpD